MKKLILFISIISFFSLQGQEINFKRVQNSMIIDLATGDTLQPTHASDAEALQHLFNEKAKGNKVKMLGAVYEVDIDIEAPAGGPPPPPPINPEPMAMWVIDTVQVLAHNYGNIRSPEGGVLNGHNKLYLFKKDSALTVPDYDFTATLERVKKWPEAETTYNLVETPFFFYRSDSTWQNTADPSKYHARTFANKQHCIKHFVNGQEIKGAAAYETISCNAGQSAFAGGAFRHTNTFYNLDRNIDNIIRLEAIDPDTGQPLGSREFVIKKL